MGLIREFRDVNHSRTRMWTTGEYDISSLTLQDFDYKINLERDNLPYAWTQWCAKNCKNKWAWWFDNKTCYVGFMDQHDAIWFTLVFKGDHFLQ